MGKARYLRHGTEELLRGLEVLLRVRAPELHHARLQRAAEAEGQLPGRRLVRVHGLDRQRRLLLALAAGPRSQHLRLFAAVDSVPEDVLDSSQRI